MVPQCDGLGAGLGDLPRRSNAQSRSISPENFSGGKGAGGAATQGTGARLASLLSRGWKISPSIDIAAGATATLAGPGRATGSRTASAC